MGRIYVKYKDYDTYTFTFNSFDTISDYNNVINISCRYNSSFSLPELPNGVKYLDCSFNKFIIKIYIKIYKIFKSRRKFW